MAAPLLAIRDLHVAFEVYGGALRVVDGVGLEVLEGEKVGLVGETGCGKTTTMKAVMGLLPRPPAHITAGQVLFDGRDVLRMPSQQLRALRGRQLAMIFQDPTAALNPVFTIGEQMMDVARYGRDRVSESEARARVLSALEEVALPDPARIMRAYPFQLSGGMRQRVCIAMALINRPRLLIADEPGTSLDVTIQDQILRLLNRIVEDHKMAILLISHSLGVVREWTDRVYVMYAGTIAETAPTPNLFATPRHPYTQMLMGTVPKLSGGGVPEGIPGRIPDYMRPPPGCRFHPRCPHVMPVCREKRPPLYDVGSRHQVACCLYQEERQTA
ncbi:MAG: ABC transporter ATP-binding protein [Armatimonadota bacterium]|nr:ABC transporter ATP-binding protein [Armatimonadota bacterium]MDR5698014.1 ABC transporter ATP-binding protein [Armatimonadota bacterium]